MKTLFFTHECLLSPQTVSFLSFFCYTIPCFFYEVLQSAELSPCFLFSRSQTAALSPGSAAASSHQRDLASSQREKRAAPQPPATNQAQDVRTLSVSPQRRSDASDNQSVSGLVTEANHCKGPAPSRPPSDEDRATLGAKAALSAVDRTLAECKPAPSVRSLNPFEDDMDDGEFAFESRVRSAKKTRAPALPANTVKQSTAPPADTVMQISARGPTDRESQPAPSEKKEPPPTTRR